MICTDASGNKHIVKFRYDRFGEGSSRVKTTCSIKLVGATQGDNCIGIVSLDSRDTHVKSVARKKSLTKALHSTNLDYPNRKSFWESFFAQTKK